MTIKERYTGVLNWFETANAEAKTELTYGDPYTLMVAVILSAQCTDKRVNIITPSFFKKFPDISTLAEATENDIFELIKSCSYPNNKSRHLLQAAKKIVSEYNCKVPEDMEELQKIPGIGRKTANVILSVAFGKPAIAVDTHVFRVSDRIGLSFKARTPLETEKQLRKYIPEHLWSEAHHWLLLHGRYICIAKKPKCMMCELKYYCRLYSKKKITSEL